jgi:uncharacterized protein YidB (DUF937 family)
VIVIQEDFQMGFLDEVISAALGAKAPPGQSQSPQSAPVQDQFSQIAAALQELLAPKQGSVSGQAAAPTPAAQQGSSGLDVLLRQFEQNGFGEIINSWIGSGQNQPISPTQLRQAMGPNTVNDLSQQSGAPQDELLAQLSKYLPGIIDKLTPNGRIPSQTDLRSG